MEDNRGGSKEALARFLSIFLALLPGWSEKDEVFFTAGEGEKQEWF